ncbi:MAG TPA: terminase small subunit [Stellaceae bacterium]
MRYTLDGEGLTPKRRAFVGEYLIDFNGTQAAIRAGYKKKSAHSLGSRLLRVPAVKAALDAAIAAQAARTTVTADRVIEEYARLAFADMRRFAAWNGDSMALRPHTALTEADAAAVVELSPVGAKGRPRIRLHDKRPALDALARHLGLFGARGAEGMRPPVSRRAAIEGARAALKERIEQALAARALADAAARENNNGAVEPGTSPAMPSEK